MYEKYATFLRLDALAMDSVITSNRLTGKGNKVALLILLFHKRVFGPLANSLFNKPPQPAVPPATKIEAAYRRADKSIQQVIELMAA